MTKENVVLYHADCLDGFGAAVVAWMHFGDKAEYVPVQYDEQECPVDVAGKNVFILDFSYPVAETNRILREAKHVAWLDHHKTAFDRWAQGAWAEVCQYTQYTLLHEGSPTRCSIVLDNTQSGAMLAWKYFFPDRAVPEMICHIDDQDRWQFKYSTTKKFIAYLASRERSFEVWGDLLMNTDSVVTGMAALTTCYALGAVLLEEREGQIESILKLAQKCHIWNGKEQRSESGLIANCPAFLRSDVGNRLAEMSGTYGATYFVQANGMSKVSLRSVGDYDVEALAVQHGGGGHKNAASFYKLGWVTSASGIFIGEEK